MSAAQKTAILAQVGHFYFGAVGQYYVGANIFIRGDRGEATIRLWMIKRERKWAVEYWKFRDP
jgi:hypothetical protein